MSPRSLRTRISGLLCALILLLVGSFSPQQRLLAAGNIIYVKANAAAGGDGSEWAKAFPKLQDGLAAATTGKEIWVAAGVYYPDEGVGYTDNDYSQAFKLKQGVAVYGGFAGTEQQLTQRNVATHITILSGDIEQDDTSGASKIVTNVGQIVADNSINVVFAEDVTGARVDGFVITAGSATQSDSICVDGACGGGLYAYNSALTLANLTFSGNKGSYGGGAYFAGASTAATLTNVLFTANKSEVFGGGLQAQNDAVVTLKSVQFVQNEAVVLGGGAYVASGATANFENATFTGNASQLQGGALKIFNATVTIKGDSTFEGNTATSHGGAINADNATLTISHAKLNRNASTTSGGGGAIYQSTGTLKLSLSEITRNNAWDLGGGLVISNVNSSLSNVKFLGNYVDAAGAETAYGGGMAVVGGNLEASNLLFSGNRSDDAGAIYLKGLTTTLRHITIGEQDAPNADSEPFAAHGILVDGASLTIENSIIWAVNQKAVQLVNGGGYIGGNTILEGEDTPSFNSFGIRSVSALPFRRKADAGDDGYGNDPVTEEDESANDDYGDLRLNGATVAIDVGDNAKTPTDPLDINENGNTSERLPIDLNGNARVVRFRAATAIVDPGAYEYVNVAPTGKIAYAYTLNEGGPIDLDATGSSDDGGISSYAWDCTNNGSTDVTENSPTAGFCTYGNSGVYTLRLTVSDSLNAKGSATAKVTVNNIAPTFTPAANQSATATSAASLSLGAFTDPGTEESWSVSINWGDNSAAEQFTVSSVGALPNKSHTYGAKGSYTVGVTVNDDKGSDNGSFKVQVAAAPAGPNTAPSYTPAANQSATAGNAASLSLGSFTDPGSSGPWQVTVDWGDDSEAKVFSVTSTGQLPKESHTYAKAGDYEITLTVSDGALVATKSFRVAIREQEEDGDTIFLPFTRK